jgi:class 3 adenylate cyclase
MSQRTTNGGTVREALLVIADIRGYTPFMKAHWTSLAHAQDVVARLLEAVIDAAPGLTPLEIEGDAAFFYTWSAVATTAAADGLIEQVVAMHRAFHACQQEIVALNTCRCEGCRQTGRLHVKFVAHVGEVAVQRVKQSAKLAGLGVILVHRMLKTAVPVPEYLLLSEPLFHAVSGPVRERGRRIEDELAGLGPTAMHVVDLSEIAEELPPRSRVTRLAQARENFGVIRRSLPYLLGLRRPRVAL